MPLSFCVSALIALAIGLGAAGISRAVGTAKSPAGAIEFVMPAAQTALVALAFAPRLQDRDLSEIFPVSRGGGDAPRP